MPYLAAVFGFSSTLSFTILTLSPNWPAISSSAGAIMRQGPHHSAQKSTTTGSDDFNTSDSKLASDTLPTAMGTPRVVSGPQRTAPEWKAPNLWTPPVSVKARSREGDARQRRIQVACGKLHQIRYFGPDERGAHGSAWIDFLQQRAVLRELFGIALESVWRVPAGLEIRDQNGVWRDDQTVDLAGHRHRLARDRHAADDRHLGPAAGRE